MASSLLSAPLSLLLLSASAAAHGGSDDDDDLVGGPADAASNLRSRPLVLVKIWCLVIVFAGTFAGGVSPYFLRWNEGFLLLGTQFAGGVFLGTAMMHFLSDSAETFRDRTSKDYPFAFMLACAGYSITMLADSVVSSICERRDEMNRGAGDIAPEGGSQQTRHGSHRVYSQSHSQLNAGTEGQCVKSSLAVARSLGDSVLLIVALCFHSVFEGIAIGVAETTGDAWKALWTVCLHKIFAAIGMGIALLRMIPERPLFSCVAYAFAFAISSPIGVGIGIIIDATTQGRVADWIYAISMGLACGVFVYVSINHLLSKGLTLNLPAAVDSPFYKFLAATLGIGVIAVVMIWD